MNKEIFVLIYNRAREHVHAFLCGNAQNQAEEHERALESGDVKNHAEARLRAFVHRDEKQSFVRMCAFVRGCERKHASIRLRAGTATILILLCLLCLFCGERVSEEIMAKMNTPQTDLAFTADNLIRLHVIANSDQANDQRVKLLVRNRILQETERLIKIKESDAALDLLRRNRRILQAAAVDELQRNGYAYSARIQIGRFAFPEKEYTFGTLAAGEYNALRVILGEGDGQNWWCVLFPPVCHLTTEEKPKHQGEEVRLRWRAWEDLVNRKEELVTTASDWFRLFQLATISSTEIPVKTGDNQSVQGATLK